MAKQNDNHQGPVPSKVADKIENALLNSRRIFLSDVVDNDTASDIIKKLWYFEMTDPGKPILFIINSPGGAVDSGFAIWDTVKLITSPVITLVTGLAASMGSILSLCATKKGGRYATPHSRIMIHQPLLSGVIKGQATDLEIQAKEILKTKRLLINIYVQETGKDFAAIEKALDRDMWMTAEEAKAFGLLDGIVNSPEELSQLYHA
ncbi:MAG: ATP-dependent Clp protease proteolytic subunit [Parachlamydiaceae bacterium]|nr:ATP-dependent Clp protease proteolytic subunit [Parachlamydiaceae bacterium]